MSKIKKYSNILASYCLDFEKSHKNSDDALTTIAIIDKERHHYQTSVHGFSKNQHGHVFIVQFHFDIIENKIWIQRNNTNVVIENDLLDLGVPKSDIVFGCVPKYGRHLEGFGVEQESSVTV